MNSDTNQNNQDQNFQQEDNQSHNPSSTDQSIDKVEMCLTELSLWKEQCKRISADFENFKKRTEREQLRWAEVAKESLILELVSFVDTFELALKQQSGDKVGIEMIYQALMKLLIKHDVVVMPHSIEFDPQIHEAIMQVSSDKHQPGQIVDFLSNGFLIKDRVLRPAKVSVAV